VHPVPSDRTVHYKKLGAAALLAGLLAGGCAAPRGTVHLNGRAPSFDGHAAWRYAVRAARFGARPPGSPAHARLLAWLERRLDAAGIDRQAVAFTARTPAGPIAMTDLIARFPGKQPGTIVIGGHYDTLSGRPRFVGANDGGSSTGMLLALAEHFHRHPPQGPSVWLVWFDGEEAIRHWQGNDHTYGSRHLARLWRADGTLGHIRAVLVVDMIGDRHLDVARDTEATPWLMDTVCREARRIGAGADFCRYREAIEDDDTPFRAAGAAAADVIDFDYGPGNAWWHTDEDTVDKLSPRSFGIVGSVILATVRALSSGDKPAARTPARPAPRPATAPAGSAASPGR